MLPIRSRRAWVAAATASFLLLAGVATGQDLDRPFDLGLTERTGANLTFVDVDVARALGRPVRGLTRDDFTAQLNGQDVSIVSVDEFCGCPSTAAATAGGQGIEAAHTGGHDDALQGTPPRFVVYLDFGQLDFPSRRRAIASVHRWIDGRPANVPVQLVATAPRTGLRVLNDWTTDDGRLHALVAELDADPDFVEPDFLSFQQLNARVSERYFAVNASLRALRAYLARLEASPGRKHMLYFHNRIQLESSIPAFNFSVPPVRSNDLFDQVIPDITQRANLGQEATGYRSFQDRLLEDVGGAATAAQTAIHVMQAGDTTEIVGRLDESPSGGSVGGGGVGAGRETAAVAGGFSPVFNNFGANLADFTGGTYTRSANDTNTRATDVGRGCECIYRVGVEAPRRVRDRPYRMRVTVQDRNVPFVYRVRFLDEYQRWQRNAEFALFDPLAQQEIPLGATLEPVRRKGKKWSVDVRVALDPRTLVALPAGEGREAEWEIGAVLIDIGRDLNWDMLAFSRVRFTERAATPEEEAAAAARPPAVVTHERRLTGLPPGTYELRSFVRDRRGDTYGGAIARLTLPRAGEPAVVGPVVLNRRPSMRAGLPAWKRRGNPPPAPAGPASELAVPPWPRMSDGRVVLRSWVCDVDRDAAERAERSLSRHDRPVPAGDLIVRKQGDCVRLEESHPRSELADGPYRYTVGLRADRATQAFVEFELENGEPVARVRASGH